MKYYITLASIYDTNVYFTVGPIDGETLNSFHEMSTTGKYRWMYLPLKDTTNHTVIVTKEMLTKFVTVVISPDEDQE